MGGAHSGDKNPSNPMCEGLAVHQKKLNELLIAVMILPFSGNVCELYLFLIKDVSKASAK